MKMNRYILLVNLLALLSSCTQRSTHSSDADSLRPIAQAILEDSFSVFYLDVRNYPAQDATLPIGIFDSGTGGLTVMDALVRFDGFRNGERAAISDGLADFGREQFIYLADQANMPYGNYHSEGKTDLLIEHVLKDAQFLLGNRYYPDASASFARTDKQPVKAIVIACNTATAYAKEHVEALVRQAGLDIPVIGVIDAGAKGALSVFRPDEDGAIAIFATVGTVASNGYVKAIQALRDHLGYSGEIQLFQQGGYGIAEAVDEEPGFIDYRAETPRRSYRGPGIGHDQYPILTELMDAYGFDFSDNRMLCDARDDGTCSVLQLNSPENYVRYHLVSLMEQLRKTPGAKPLKALVLGCTHYPFLTEVIRGTLAELYDFRRDDTYVYRHLMAPDIRIVDPAMNVAIELYQHLLARRLFNPAGRLDSSEFYISVPNMANPDVQTDSLGHFTYAYKYGRQAGIVQEYVRVVPFSRKNIPIETINRMGETIAETFGLIRTFNSGNAKTAGMDEEDRIR